ncbi:MAG: hypothetical protein ACJ75F_05460 [Flavisolibacter sp.]
MKPSSIILFSLLAVSHSPKKPGEWVYQDNKGTLIYKTLPKGDHIMDFSYAGYMGGGIQIPSPPVKDTISPVGGDNSASIQAAIDLVSKMKPVNGFCGTVLLKPGTYECDTPININSSGVVLRGSGAGKTIIRLTGKPHIGIVVKGNVTIFSRGNEVSISDDYVPSGTNSFHVSDASGFSKGDSIQITKPVTNAWVHFMKMDSLVRDGKKQTWINGVITTERIISKISGNTIYTDVPLTDNYDAAYLGKNNVRVVKISTTGELHQVGIEDLSIEAPEQSVTINDSHHRAFTMSGISDGWAKNLSILNTVNSVSITGRRITIDHVNIIHTVPTIGAAKPADLNGSGQQLLFNQCTIVGDNLFFFGTGAKVTGPVVLLNCIFKGNGWIQPHQRWATGLLIDGCSVPDGGIDFMNRGEMGSGHGWAIGWAVAWNCSAKSYLNQMPPGAANWVIGCRGEKQQRAMPFETQPLLQEGIYDSHGSKVSPESLYRAQLAERLGKGALSPKG